MTRDDRCVVLDHKYTLSICLTENRLLQDNPKVWWDTDLVAKTVEEYVKKWKIDAIITFDDGGVSGHINHRAVSAGVRFYLLLYLILIKDTMRYQKHLSSQHIELTTVFVLRKYSHPTRLTSRITIFRPPSFNYNVSRR